MRIKWDQTPMTEGKLALVQDFITRERRKVDTGGTDILRWIRNPLYPGVGIDLSTVYRNSDTCVFPVIRINHSLWLQ